MNIVFICGSLEPGRDGVGDYTRRLGLELVRNGVHAALIAINDRHIETVEQTELKAGAAGMTVLRLPANLSGKERFLLAKSHIAQLNPDWLSLQYVPFSFHPKGLGFDLARQLRDIGKDRKWEIMFHEIAVGMPLGSSLKDRVWGKAQKYIAKNLLKTLMPRVIHTHTLVYKRQIEKFGSKAVLLPLFSNIPVSHPQLVLEKQAGEHIDLLVFASIQLGAPIREFAREVSRYEKKHGVKIRMVFLGRNGKAQEDWIREWKEAGLQFLQYGEQTEDKVSEILARSVYGICSTPLVLTGKSGAVAAMREHAVHLLCVSGKWEARGLKVNENPYQIIEYKEGELEQFFSGKSDFSNLPTVSKVAEKFSADLLNN